MCTSCLHARQEHKETGCKAPFEYETGHFSPCGCDTYYRYPPKPISLAECLAKAKVEFEAEKIRLRESYGQNL